MGENDYNIESIEDIGLTKTQYMHPKDWGAGYYPADTLHTNLVTKLLMYGYMEDDALDIPHGDIRGVYKLPGVPLIINDIAPVGFTHMNRNPQHQTFQ